MVICSKQGSREKCPTCHHGAPHERSVLHGCENGMCLPDIKDETTGAMMKQNYPCVDIIEPTEVEI